MKEEEPDYSKKSAARMPAPKSSLPQTFWRDVDDKTGEKRVQERQNSSDFWGKMVGDGAKIMKHDNTAGSARRIVATLVKNASTVVLQMQQELAQNDGKVIYTSAGR